MHPFSTFGFFFSLQAMDDRGSAPSSLPAEPQSPVSENPACGDEELDEETMKHISALYTALGPLLPEVTQLQSHQDPPARLMVDMKAKLKELGSSVSDARTRMLRYNIYLKKKLAKAVQERAALREQSLRQEGVGTEQPSITPLPKGARSEVEPEKSSMGTEKHIQEIVASEIPRIKPPPERVQRRVKLQEAPLATEDTGQASATPQGFPQKNASNVDNVVTRTTLHDDCDLTKDRLSGVAFPSCTVTGMKPHEMVKNKLYTVHALALARLPAAKREDSQTCLFADLPALPLKEAHSDP
uniref:Uncharacterized protein isoform X1 n=2 Tax=Pogona vitticeps TaxID=103695 RepID=A0ABM5FHZ1_9SAUR